MGRLRPRFKNHEQARPRRAPADLYDAALRHFLSKRYGSAEERARQALALDPKHADALHLLGLVHWQTKRPAHSACYARASLEAAGLVVLQLEQQPIRCEAGVPVPGLVIVAEKR